MPRGPRPHPMWNLDADFAVDLAARGELQTVLDLIGQFSLWVDPRVARAVPIVFPLTARLVWGRQHVGQIVDGVRLWMNQPAQEAVYRAIDSRGTLFSGANVCHLYPKSPYLSDHFTRLANLTVVPASLAAFTEWEPVLAAVQWRAFELYGYTGPADRSPDRPSNLPARWSGPTPLTKARLHAVVGRLKRLRQRRPMWVSPRAPTAGSLAGAMAPVAIADDLSWSQVERELGLASATPSLKDKDARRFDDEFWEFARAAPGLQKTLFSWFVRHAYFATPRVAAAVPNPFPRTRRLRLSKGEKVGQIVDGVTLGTSTPSKTALLVAIGANLHSIRGGSVDHAWPTTPYLPAHNCHLGGLVLIPHALATIADSEPIRELLQFHLFELTGYKGPEGRKPPRPASMPESWPNNRPLSRAQEDRAIATLRWYLREKPQYYRKREPGGPGRPPPRN